MLIQRDMTLSFPTEEQSRSNLHLLSRQQGCEALLNADIEII